VGPDGALYISDDITGRIYKVTYSGGPVAAPRPCASATAPAGPIMAVEAKSPEGTHPDAGLPVSPGATEAMVALGDRVYRGQEGGASCAGCHGASGKGSPLGPDLTDQKWLWSDGSAAGITKTITEGVMQPKEYRSPMPPMGGAQLTSDQVNALGAYVWAISHH
jgi:mono/diheme cytochrome c family protein